MNPVLLLLAASLPGVAVVGGAILALCTFIMAGVYTIRYIKATGAQAELAAKDEIIRTNHQTIESLESRLRTISEDLAETNRRLTAAETLIRSMKGLIEERNAQYEALKQYTAPEAVKEVRELLTEQYNQMTETYKAQTETIINTVEQISQDRADSNLSELTNRLAQIQHELNPKHIFAVAPTSAGVGTWWWDTSDAEEPHWSDSMLSLLGLKQRISAEEYSRRVVPEDIGRYTEIMENAVTNKEPFDFFYGFRRPDGQTIRLRARGDFINSEKRRMVGTVEDVTHVKAR